MADMKKLLDIINETSVGATASGSVATVAQPLASTQKRVAEEQKDKMPKVLEYGNWENSALTTSEKLKSERKKAAKIVKSIYGEDTVEEAKTPEQQSAIAIAKKKKVAEGSYDWDDETYADRYRLSREIEKSPHEVSMLVDKMISHIEEREPELFKRWGTEFLTNKIEKIARSANSGKSVETLMSNLHKELDSEKVEEVSKKIPASNTPVDPKDLVVALKDVPVKKPRGHKQYDPAKEFPGVKAFKEQRVMEVSDESLKSYQQKVSDDSMKHRADPTKRSPEKASKSVAGFAKAQKRLEKNVAEDLNEMDKSAPQPGHDGKVSHSTYGSRDKKGSEYFTGKEALGKNITAKQAEKDALDILKKQGVAEGYILKKTKVEKTFTPGNPGEYYTSGGADVTRKDTDYEIINNKTGQVVGTASWTTNDYFGPGALKITMKNGATRWLDIRASEKGNPQTAFNRFVKDPKTAKKYKEQGVAEDALNEFYNEKNDSSGDGDQQPPHDPRNSMAFKAGRKVGQEISNEIPLQQVLQNIKYPDELMAKFMSGFVEGRKAKVKWLNSQLKSHGRKANLRQNGSIKISDITTESEHTSSLEESDLIIAPASMSKLTRGLIKPSVSRVDHEISMAKSDLYQSAKNSIKIFELIKDKSEEEGIEGWVQEKIIKATDYLNTVREYLEGQKLQDDPLESMDGVGPSTKMFTSENKKTNTCESCGKKWKFTHECENHESTESVEEDAKRPGLWANIRAKQKRIKSGSGERMREPGSAGAPTDKQLKDIRKASNESTCSECGGPSYDDPVIAEEKDACYHKVKSRYKVWPSAYASGALVKCRKVGAKNWGNKSKK